MSTTGQQLPLFLRKWKVEVQLPDSTDLLVITSEDDEALRVVFDIYTPALHVWWTADVTIYNLDQLTIAKLTTRPIKQGAKVTVSAGYQHGNFGVIWSGPVFQPIFDRENVVDFKITLSCLLGLDQFLYNQVNFAYNGGLSQYEILQRMVAEAFHKIPVGTISQTKLQAKKLPRGGVVFGRPDRYLNNWANANNSQWWFSPSGLQFGQADDDVPTQSTDFVYTPETGIIGVPQQTQYGILVTVLLDPRLLVTKPLPVIKIDNTIIRQTKKEIGEFPNILDQDGEYIVGAVRHSGDTRGNVWYTEITGVTSTKGKMSMLQAAVGGTPDMSTNTPF